SGDRLDKVVGPLESVDRTFELQVVCQQAASRREVPRVQGLSVSVNYICRVRQRCHASKLDDQRALPQIQDAESLSRNAPTASGRILQADWRIASGPGRLPSSRASWSGWARFPILTF